MDLKDEGLMALNSNLTELMKQVKRIADKLDEWTFESSLSTYQQKPSQT